MDLNLISSLTISNSFGNLSFDNQNYIMTSIKGFEAPLLRIPRYNNPAQNGATISNILQGERDITIQGYVNAPDSIPTNQKITTYLSNRRLLINSIAYYRDVYGNLEPQTLDITLVDGTSVSCQVYQDKPLQMAFSEGQVDYEAFSISLVAPDPNLYSTVQTVINLGLSMGGGTAVPTVMPLSLAPSSGGQVTVNNPGANEAFPVLTLIGPLTNPFVANLTTDQFLQLSMTINASDAPIIIDMGAQTVLQNGNDVSTNMTFNSTFWGLFRNANNIGFSASAGSGTLTLSFYANYIGL